MKKSVNWILDVLIMVTPFCSVVFGGLCVFKWYITSKRIVPVVDHEFVYLMLGLLFLLSFLLFVKVNRVEKGSESIEKFNNQEVNNMETKDKLQEIRRKSIDDFFDSLDDGSDTDSQIEKFQNMIKCVNEIPPEHKLDENREPDFMDQLVEYINSKKESELE